MFFIINATALLKFPRNIYIILILAMAIMQKKTKAYILKLNLINHYMIQIKVAQSKKKIFKFFFCVLENNKISDCTYNIN